MPDHDDTSLPNAGNLQFVESEQPVPQGVLPADLQPRPITGEQVSHWLGRIFACNPLYLVSAALLLYSFYLVSADPNFLRAELPQLWFKLSSLQLYEIVLVVTAIFLAGRAVWYDSTLLVGLENLLLLVPFILVSQAALIDTRLVWILCGAAGLLAALRLGILKRFVAQLNFPPRVLGIGMVMLVVNAALPVIYRLLHESKVGTRADWGSAYETNQYAWWLVGPALCALMSLVPSGRNSGKLWPQRGWLPLVFFFLWLVGTGVHLYCLGYVYDFALRPELLAPAVWMLCWMVYRRLLCLTPDLEPTLKKPLWMLPVLATLLATPQPEKQVFLTLTVLNVGIYGGMYRQQRAPMVFHLLLISLVALIGGLPETWGLRLTAQFSREMAVGAGVALYLVTCAALSRNPKLGILGAITSGVVVGVLLQGADAVHWALQAGLVFLLLHSLRWSESREEGTGLVRWGISLAWVAHSFVWAHAFGAGWHACTTAAPVIGVVLAVRWLQGQWGPVAVPVAALLVVLSTPFHLATTQLKSAPAAVLAVIGSFVLFGLGTLAAVMRHKWENSRIVSAKSRSL
jgi:hypothetical protein